MLPFVSTQTKRRFILQLHKTYFTTSTIVGSKPLLENDVFAEIIIQSLKYLASKELIKVYAFVIMPNHIHLIWKAISRNGKEMPNASLMKYTSHKFLEEIRNHYPYLLKAYAVDFASRRHYFWLKNSLSTELYTKRELVQKINEIHSYPVKGKWKLCYDPLEYKYSSALFYETNRDEFGFLSFCS